MQLIAVQTIENCYRSVKLPGSNDGELTINEGDVLVIVEHDLDGSGWTKVMKNDEEGFVPSSYIEVI